MQTHLTTSYSTSQLPNLRSPFLSLVCVARLSRELQFPVMSSLTITIILYTSLSKPMMSVFVVCFDTVSDDDEDDVVVTPFVPFV